LELHHKQSSFKEKVEALKEAFGSDSDGDEEDAKSEEPDEDDQKEIEEALYGNNQVSSKMNDVEKQEEEKQ
jgi:hypothetical protein